MNIFLPNKYSFVISRENTVTRTRTSSPLFSPSSDSFVLARKTVTEVSSPVVTRTRNGSPLFSPSSDSFVLARKTVTEISSPVRTNTRTGSPLFSPSSDSFVLARKTVTEISAPVGNEIRTGSPLFSPSSDSFVLARKTVTEINSPDGNGMRTVSQSEDSEQIEVDDNGKRQFLKLAGLASAGVIASQLLPKKAEAFIMGSSPTTGVVGVKDSSNVRINPATEETLDSVLKTSDLTFDSGDLQVKVTSLPGDAGTPSFSDSLDAAKSALVDIDRHVQVDVLSSALPDSASTETTLQTLSYGGVQYSLRLETVGDYDYIGEASVGSATSSSVWRIKRVDNTSGDINILWADGDETFDNVWDNRASLTYA